MTHLDILKAFELEINKSDNPIEKPITSDSLYWLNQAVNKFVKLRFNGDLVHKTSYEETEKRRNDLIRLYRTKSYSELSYTTDDSYCLYSVEYPSDFLYTTDETVTITNTSENNPYYTGVFECTQDNYSQRIDNNLTDFHYRFGKARPIRIRTSNGCNLLTDKNYLIKQYTLGYIKTPDEINLDSANSSYSDFDDSTMFEIIKIAA